MKTDISTVVVLFVVLFAAAYFLAHVAHAVVAGTFPL